MNIFFNNLVENKKQKFIAVIYIISLLIDWIHVTNHNGSGTCASRGHDCYSLFTASLIITVIFIIVASIFRNKQQNNN